MEEIRLKKRRRRIIGFSILGAVIVAIIAIIVACSLSGNKEDVKEGEYKQVEKRTIANSVSGNGVVTSVDKEEVTSQQFGSKVKAVYVKEADTVSAGQVICQLDTKNLQDQLNDLRKNISDAKNNKIDQDANYDRRISEARSNRQKNIADTETRLNNARVEYLQSLNELEVANNNYNNYMADPSHHTYDLEATQLQTVIEAKKSNVDLKKNTIDSYEETLNNLRETNDSDLDDARTNYDESADSTIQSMEDQARELEKAIGECTIRCTIGGTVTTLNVKNGETFNGGTVCTIEGLNDFMVEAEISEYDIPDVATGMKVMMKTDATRDKELQGIVTFVAPRATSSGASNNLGALSGMIGMDMSEMASSSGSGNNSATFKVRIALNEQNPRLRLGMNAKISIITESVDNAISVPVDAVQEDDSGNKYVEVATNYDEASKSDGEIEYEKKKVNVNTGLKGSYYIQVIGDINVGDYVYVPPAQGEDSIDEIMNMMGSSAGI